MENKLTDIPRIICISNFGNMVGGGEHSYMDLLVNLSPSWKPIAVIPHEGDLAHLLRKASIEPYVIQLSTIRPWTLISIIKSLKTLSTLIRKIKPELVYANGTRAAFYSNISKILYKVPVIWHCRIAEKDRKLDFMLRRLSDIIICNSVATSTRFGDLQREKIKVVYNGVDIRHLRKPYSSPPDLFRPDRKIILVVGRVSKQKKHDIALDVFNKLAPSQENAHIVFVGNRDPIDNKWWEILQNKSKQSAYSNRIHWVGHLDDIRPWYKHASLLFFPAENEAFGRVIVEAMACGLPVVAAKSGGVPEILRHKKDGWLAKPGNTHEMALAIKTLLKNEDIREDFSQSSKKRAELFNLENHILSMKNIFEQTVKGYGQKA